MIESSRTLRSILCLLSRDSMIPFHWFLSRSIRFRCCYGNACLLILFASARFHALPSVSMSFYPLLFDSIAYVVARFYLFLMASTALSG